MNLMSKMRRINIKSFLKYKKTNPNYENEFLWIFDSTCISEEYELEICCEYANFNVKNINTNFGGKLRCHIG
jgi:hypothetical protein